MAVLGQYVSFSDLVDRCAARTNRPVGAAVSHITESIAVYANSTIRQIANTGLYSVDLIEERVNVTATPHIWQKPRNFKQMAAVRYNIVTADGIVYPTRREPGKDLNEFDIHYYYYSGDSIIFNGVSVGTEIGIAYYSRPRRFVYYPLAERPVRFNEDTGDFEYLAGINNEADREIAREKCLNWVIERWFELCQEGVISKIYNQLNDPRGKTVFANFRDLLQDVPANELTGHTETSQLPVNTAGGEVGRIEVT